MIAIVKNKTGRYKGKVVASSFRRLSGDRVRFWHIIDKRFVIEDYSEFKKNHTFEVIRP